MKNIIIIGTGIVGSTTAYLLAKNKVNITMIDAEHPGRATTAGAGIIAPWANKRRNKVWYKLAKNGAAYYSELIESLQDDGFTNTSYEKVGSLQLYQDEEKAREMYDIVAKKREDAPEIGKIDLLDQQMTKAAFPYVADGYQALHIAGAAKMDGNQFRNTLMKAATLHGASYIHGQAKLLDAHTVQVNNTTFTADAIVLANGVWMNDTLSTQGIKTNFYMQKGQVVHLHLPNMTRSFPLVNIPSDPYIVPFPNGRIVIGATREDNVAMDPNHSLRGIPALLEKAFAFAPGLANGQLLDIKAGFRPYTPSFIPTFGRLPTMESVYFANGLGSSGLTTGPYIGKTIAAAIREEQPTIDWNNYTITPYLQ